MEKDYCFSGAKNLAKLEKDFKLALRENSNGNMQESRQSQFCDLVAFGLFAENFDMSFKTQTSAAHIFIENNRNKGINLDEKLINLVGLGLYFDDIRKNNFKNVNYNTQDLYEVLSLINIGTIAKARIALPKNETLHKGFFAAATLNNYKIKKGKMPKDMNKFLKKVVKIFDKNYPQKQTSEEVYE